MIYSSSERDGLHTISLQGLTALDLTQMTEMPDPFLDQQQPLCPLHLKFLWNRFIAPPSFCIFTGWKGLLQHLHCNKSLVVVAAHSIALTNFFHLHYLEEEKLLVWKLFVLFGRRQILPALIISFQAHFTSSSPFCMEKYRWWTEKNIWPAIHGVPISWLLPATTGSHSKI